MADESSNAILDRMLLILQQRHLRDAMRVLNDGAHDGGMAAVTLLSLNMIRRRLNTAVLAALRDAGNDEQRIFRDLRRLVIQAIWETRAVWQEELERLSQAAGFMEDDVPAPATAAAAAATAVRSLEKQRFRAAAAAGGENDDGVTECSICLVEFVDGEQVSVMPCPFYGHQFHPDCISKWMEIRNTCPLCRHQQPTADAYDRTSEASSLRP